MRCLHAWTPGPESYSTCMSAHRHMAAALLFVIVNNRPGRPQGHNIRLRSPTERILNGTSHAGRLVLAGLGLRNVCSPCTLGLAPDETHDRTALDTVGRCPSVVRICQVHQRSQALARTDISSPQGPFFSRLAGAGLTLGMHARIPYKQPCLPMPPYWADYGSQYRISGAIRFWLFPAPWVLGYIVVQPAVPQCHSTTGYVSPSAALRPAITFVHSRTKKAPIRRPQHHLCHLCNQAGGASRLPRARDENVLPQQSKPLLPPPPSPPISICQNLQLGFFKHLPSPGLVSNASRQMREAFAHQASRLMHGRVLDMSCRGVVQSVALAGAPGPRRSSR